MINKDKNTKELRGQLRAFLEVFERGLLNSGLSARNVNYDILCSVRNDHLVRLIDLIRQECQRTREEIGKIAKENKLPVRGDYTPDEWPNKVLWQRGEALNDGRSKQQDIINFGYNAALIDILKIVEGKKQKKAK